MVVGTRRGSSRWRRRLAVLAVSLAAHGALLARAPRPRSACPEARRIGPLATQVAARVVLAARIAEDRARLVASARAELHDGRLALGEFLLRANALDAEERGAPFALDEARALYRARVDALRGALAREGLRLAVPEVLADLRYFGRPGGLMADALFDRGGSCEQVSHLIAAAAHDSGLGGRVALRFYGGAMDGGAAHLAPVEIAGTGEIDLLTGRPAYRRGTRFAATELVEAYARVHGLAPPLPAPPAPRAAEPASSPAEPEPGRPSLTAGYPPNADRFPGTVPLYAARAVAAARARAGGEGEGVDEAGGAVAASHREAGAHADDDDGAAEAAALEQRSRAHDCAFFVRMAALDPPTLEIEPGHARDTFRVELRKVPAPSQIERKAALLRGAEDMATGNGDPVDRLMADACVAALSHDIAVDFALVGERRLGELSLGKGKDAAARGAGALAALARSGTESVELDFERRLTERFAGQTWLLLFLEGGDRVVLRLARQTAGAASLASASDWGRVEALAALAVDPTTRARAYAIFGDLPRRAQVDVMHEIFHAHDHLRPWASSYALDDDSPAFAGHEFHRAYRVFRALAARFWEGQRPVEQTLTALAQDARAAGLDPEWEALFLDYYGRNLIGVYQSRAGAPEMMRLLTRAVEENRHPALGALRRLIDAETNDRIGARPVL